MADLYPGIAFSPQAALTNNIGAGDTIIKVSDVSAFPPAPNLATIGTDETGETILYAAKTADALSGCQRGVEGEARAWSAGELIGRNFTAKDHADLIAAVGESKTAAVEALNVAETAQEFAEGLADSKQDALSGQPGQVVGFDADGTAQAVRGWSNPNLLDNWYFLGLINQRKQSAYPQDGGFNYTIDRWVSNCTVTVMSGNGLRIRSAPSVYERFAQRLDVPLRPGDVVTLTFLVADPVGSWYIEFSYNKPDTQEPAFLGLKKVTEPGISLVTTTVHIPSEWNYAIPPSVYISHDGIDANEGYITLLAAKLELGPVQTLAHQDTDANLVLNDPPPNKALELAKCQRYFVRYNGRSLLGCGVSYSTERATVQAWLPVPMRTMPLVVTNGDIKLTSAYDSATASKILVAYRSQNEITLDVTSESLTVGRVSRLDLAEGSYLDFNADL